MERPIPNDIVPGTVVVTGAGGLLGRSADTQFSYCRWKVVALARAALDIADESLALQALDYYKPSVVINCAAATDVDRCEREPDWAYRANEQGPRNLARACH